METEKQAAAISYYFSERRNDIAELVEAEGVRNFFRNRDLGMSFQYGLGISVQALEDRFERIADRKQLAGQAAYTGLMLIDSDGVPIARWNRPHIGEGGMEWLTTDNHETRILVSQNKSELLVVTPIWINATYRGALLAWSSLNTSLAQFGQRHPDWWVLFVDRNGGTPMDAGGNLQQIATEFGGDLKNLLAQPDLSCTELHSRDGDSHVLAKVAIDGTPIAFVSIAGEHFRKQNTMFLLLIAAGGAPFIVLLVAFLDIRERRRMEVQLDLARVEAERLAQARSDFLANMSHEIRTPMTAIIGMTELCMDTPLNDQQRNYVNKIKSAGEALLHIINDILDFSKIDAGKLQIERIPFMLETVFDQLSSVLALRAESQGIELSYDIDDDSLFLVGDPLRMGQVLINLVGNALKFSEGGNVLVRVETVRTETTEVELHFSVRDEGVGMTSEQMTQLFQPFVQADASTTRRYGGSGLGLAISRHLIEMMGGHIWAESEVGGGSTFHFTLCCNLDGPDRRLGIAPPGNMFSDHAERTVLIVDENATARRILERLLNQLGIEVHAAANAEEALARARAPDLPNYLACLVDGRMPEMEGINTLRHLREILAERGVRQMPPMILVTAYSHHDALRDIGHEIDGILAKPIVARHLYAEMARSIGGCGTETPTRDRRQNTSLPWAQFRHLDILLVEDVEVNQEVISELLANVGLSVRLASNGVVALEAVKQQRPDLILMDCHMPIMDGYTATRRLRENPETRDLPIIALTANALESDKDKCFAAGMNAHVAKPIRMDALYERLVHCLPSAVINTEVSAVAAKSLPILNLPEFPGINVALALAHVEGRLPLLLKVLKQFRDHQGRNFERQFKEAMENPDGEARVRLAHSLKGVALTLGAEDLAEAAVALLAAAEAHDAVKYRQLFPTVLDRLRVVIQGLKDLEQILELSPKIASK
jgi:signal transduction histidine kinase/CheY-like chemotaxis protein